MKVIKIGYWQHIVSVVVLTMGCILVVDSLISSSMVVVVIATLVMLVGTYLTIRNISYRLELERGKFKEVLFGKVVTEEKFKTITGLDVSIDGGTPHIPGGLYPIIIFLQNDGSKKEHELIASASVSNLISWVHDNYPNAKLNDLILKWKSIK